jgi:catechol 2,3-dioxygenase-like lactoylglutathione lyase family enzyme
MGVSRLEHINIRCTRLQATRDFYVGLMGLTEGPRPNFPFRGHWLYLGDVPVIHLAEAADHPGSWSGTLAREDVDGTSTGPFDHVAFRGEDFEAMRAKLAAAGLRFRERIVPGGALKQLFVPDPEGVMVELNFEA